MQIIAKVLEYEISQSDIERECAKLKDEDSLRVSALALQHLIDRCLLLSKAIKSGIEITDREYDSAIMELIETENPFGLSSSDIQFLAAQEIEILLRRHLLIKKYVQTLYPDDLPLTAERLRELYAEHPDIFISPEKLRLSHILFSGQDLETERKAMEIRAAIKHADDFIRYSHDCSDCPSNTSGGDLGWITRGKLTQAMDEIAFSLELGEISPVFKSPFGYHILMLTEQKPARQIPFSEIESSLQARIIQLEREYILSKHVAELRKEFASQIIIHPDYSQQA